MRGCVFLAGQISPPNTRAIELSSIGKSRISLYPWSSKRGKIFKPIVTLNSCLSLNTIPSLGGTFCNQHFWGSLARRILFWLKNFLFRCKKGANFLKNFARKKFNLYTKICISRFKNNFGLLPQEKRSESNISNHCYDLFIKNSPINPATIAQPV